jgi:hypothetical protein
MKVKLIVLRSLLSSCVSMTAERSNSPPVSPIDDLAEL